MKLEQNVKSLEGQVEGYTNQSKEVLRPRTHVGEKRQAQASAAMSLEVRDTLTRFGVALEAVSEKLHAAEIKAKKAEVRAKLYGSFASSLADEHKKILARRLIIERRKEEAERVASEEEREASRLKAQQLREEEDAEKAKRESDLAMRHRQQDSRPALHARRPKSEISSGAPEVPDAPPAPWLIARDSALRSMPSACVS